MSDFSFGCNSMLCLSMLEVDVQNQGANCNISANYRRSLDFFGYFSANAWPENEMPSQPD
jgi:hypothetical protein